MYNNKRKGIIGIIITIVILVILVLITNIDKAQTYEIENVISKIVSPVQNGITYIKNKISGNTSYFSSMEELRKENSTLKEENSKLEQSLRELETLQAENNTLKEYLNLTEKYQDYKTVPAYIINKDISNYTKTVVINVGKDDGIEENMTVIADQGLVGYVISVTSDTAKVQTIIDSSSATSSVTTVARDSMVCRGTIENNNTLKSTYISTDANIVEGDLVETSGIGGIYPKGIHIGKVTKVVEGKNKTDNYALVETAVDFNKLDNVLVITN